MIQQIIIGVGLWLLTRPAPVAAPTPAAPVPTIDRTPHIDPNGFGRPLPPPPLAAPMVVLHNGPQVSNS